jgi:hypothetical protein
MTRSRMTLFEGHYKLFDTPGESVEARNDHDIKLPAAGAGYQGLQSRPLFPGSADPVLVDLSDGPATLRCEGR